MQKLIYVGFFLIILGGLSPLRRLHTLLASENQIVSPSGIGDCPTIQKLDLSANYLTTIVGLNKLGLLVHLNAASNNLSEVRKKYNLPTPGQFLLYFWHQGDDIF